MESSDDELGGDAACWLAQLCPECGAMLESRSAPCWRCGATPGERADDALPDQGD